MKFCKHCKHCKPDLFLKFTTLGFGNDQWRFAKCLRPEAVKDYCKGDDMIAPMPPSKKDFKYCSTMREFRCGESAELFGAISP